MRFKNAITLDVLDAPVEVKTDAAKGRGFFAALVSVFGNADRNGDRVLPGAFTKTLANWKQAGNPIPVIWSHQHGDLPSMLGGVDPNDVQETKDGLVVAGRLDIENNPKAAEVFALMQKGLITNWSFAFETRDFSMTSDGIRELKQIDLFEVGPTLVGANPEARTLALKSATVEEKSPPWHVEERAGEFCVILDEDGSTVKCHPTKAEATAHMRALYANATSADPEVKEREIEDKRGRRISSATAATLSAFKTDLQRHIAALDELLEEVEEAAPVTQADLARQEMADVATFLSERGM